MLELTRLEAARHALCEHLNREALQYELFDDLHDAFFMKRRRQLALAHSLRRKILRKFMNSPVSTAPLPMQMKTTIENNHPDLKADVEFSNRQAAVERRTRNLIQARDALLKRQEQNRMYMRCSTTGGLT